MSNLEFLLETSKKLENLTLEILNKLENQFSIIVGIFVHTMFKLNIVQLFLIIVTILKFIRHGLRSWGL
jgi:hypothetical protein